MTTRFLALFTLAFFLVTAFRLGWTRAETDFPNYYTAAVLVRTGQPLRRFYDWTWFQRQMNYAGTEHQLGAYTPQTPLTMLPLLPLTLLPVQQAKQVWLLCNLAFLAITIWLLSQVTRFRMETIWLLAFCGYFSLYTNFLYGQYYVFLLLLLTASFYFLFRGHPGSSGTTAGIAFGLKLYGGPLLLFYLLKRKWRAAAAMGLSMALLAILAVALFGWSDIHYYLTQVLARSLEGSSVDPYSAGAATISNMLRHVFVMEPELNPHPLWNSPGLFFFLRTLITLSIAAIVVLGLAVRPTTDRRDFAWVVAGTVLLSTSTGSYTFILLLLPLVLLLEESSGWQNVLYIACYILLTLPLRPVWLFPKVWLLLIFFGAIRREVWRELRRPLAMAGATIVLLAALAFTKVRMAAYDREPGQRYERVAVERGAMFSCYPVITRAGLFYQSMGKDRYVLRWLHDGRNDELSFPGEALLPSAPDADGIVYFELVAHGASTMMQFDPASGRATPASVRVGVRDADSALSPDRKWVAFTASVNDTKQVWLRYEATGKERALTDGRCNSWAPAWELDSKAIVFASDCGRALGLPALYRAQAK